VQNFVIVRDGSRTESGNEFHSANCCKGDAASQWEMAIFGMTELRNAWTDWPKISHTWLRWWADLVCQIS